MVVSRRFVKFVLMSGIAAIANIASRIAFNMWVGFATAIVLAYCIGMCTAFVLNRLFVFRETSNPFHHQAFWFTVVNLAAVVQTLVISLLLAEIAFPALGFKWHAETVAHVIGVGVPAITSYLGHKHLSFRASTPRG